MQDYLQGRPSGIMGGKDAESPDSEAGYVSAVTDIQYRAGGNSDCIGYDRQYVHMVFDKRCPGGCSVHILAVSCELKEMSGQPGHRRTTIRNMAARRGTFYPRNKCPT